MTHALISLGFIALFIAALDEVLFQATRVIVPGSKGELQ